ncbi:hypothetical protein [Microcoleus sp. T3B2]|uniref:hypothetical protein n=1 Tax=Microcoleus sp. T3B2 TaxID=3055426 RepID=UPI002FD2C353
MVALDSLGVELGVRFFIVESQVNFIGFNTVSQDINNAFCFNLIGDALQKFLFKFGLIFGFEFGDFLGLSIAEKLQELSFIYTVDAIVVIGLTFEIMGCFN